MRSDKEESTKGGANDFQMSQLPFLGSFDDMCLAVSGESRTFRENVAGRPGACFVLSGWLFMLKRKILVAKGEVFRL